MLGDNLGYFIGRWVGTPLLSWLERQRRFQFISPTTLARGRAYFRRKTAWAIFISRFLIVALGGPINLLAGIEQYPFRNFLLWDVCGQILGAAIPLSLGYIFAESWEEVAGILGAFSGLFLAFLATILLSVLLVRKIRQRRASIALKVEENISLQPTMSVVEHDTSPLPIPE